MKRYEFAALAAQHLRDVGMMAIQWGDELLAHEIADKTGLAHEGPATIIKVLDRLEGSPFFRKSIVALGRVRRARRFELINPGAGPGDRRTLLTADVWKSLPRELCPACGGTRSISVDTKKYVGQIVQVGRGGEIYEAEVNSATESDATYTLLTGATEGRPRAGETWTAGRSAEYFDPVPFATSDASERWCECGDRALPF